MKPRPGATISTFANFYKLDPDATILHRPDFAARGGGQFTHAMLRRPQAMTTRPFQAAMPRRSQAKVLQRFQAMSPGEPRR